VSPSADDAAARLDAATLEAAAPEEDAANADVETSRVRRRSPMVSLFYDVGLSLVSYYGLRLLGADTYIALLAGTATAAFRLVYVLWSDRQFDRFAAFMVFTFGVGLALTFVTGDPRFLLVKDSVGTGLSGAVFGVSYLLGRPLMLTAVQRFGAESEEEAREMEEWFVEDGLFRHLIAVFSAVWCFGLIGEAALRIPLIYLLPVDVMAGVSTAMWVVAFGGLFAWTQWYGARSRA
jgi:type IV secretory pathway TrbD component